MIGRTAVVVDSTCYLPQSFVERHGLLVVPLSVEIDGQTYRETELGPDDFYGRLPVAKSVTTTQPSPGQFAESYDKAQAQGAEAVLSIHIGSNLSGTVNSARLAAEASPVPVTVVDTKQASFAEGLCVLEAIEALEAGKSAAEAAAAAEQASGRIGNTFVVRALDLPRRGGRLLGDAPVAGVPVMALTADGMKVVGSAADIEEAVDMMSAHVRDAAPEGRRLRVGVGHGAAPEVAAALRERLSALPAVAEIIHYVVGPAIGVHTGAGNAGAVFIAR